MLSACVRSIIGKKPFPTNKASSFISRNRSTVAEAQFETPPFHLHKFEQGPSTQVTLTRDEAIQLYTKMNTIRRIETTAANLYKEKTVRGFCHLYSGEEAIAVGFKPALRDQDSVITAYRAHGWTYMMGASPYSIIAELAQKETGGSRAKGGSMHMYARNFYGGNGIVGAQVPLGTGVALAAHYKDTDGVCVICYGDGASNQGQVFESFNIAKLKNLPCVYVCENNGYGMGTSAERSSASTDYYTRGDYIPGIWVDGMDVLAVREAAKFAINHSASGKGPIVVEAKTYRYYGHSMSDPGTSYRTHDEVQEVRKHRDPITTFKEKIISHNLVTAEDIKEIDAKIKSEIDDATKKAKADKDVGLDELYTDIYSENLGGPIRGLTIFEPHQHKRIGAAINTVAHH